MTPRRNVRKLQNLSDELEEFLDEVDTSDAEWTQVLFKRRVSNLIRDRVLITDKLTRKVSLRDVLEIVLHNVESDVVQNAELFDSTIDSYGGAPDIEQMDDAVAALSKVVDYVKGLVPKNALT